MIHAWPRLHKNPRRTVFSYSASQLMQRTAVGTNWIRFDGIPLPQSTQYRIDIIAGLLNYCPSKSRVTWRPQALHLPCRTKSLSLIAPPTFNIVTACRHWTHHTLVSNGVPKGAGLWWKVVSHHSTPEQHHRPNQINRDQVPPALCVVE